MTCREECIPGKSCRRKSTRVFCLAAEWSRYADKLREKARQKQLVKQDEENKQVLSQRLSFFLPPRSMPDFFFFMFRNKTFAVGHVSSLSVDWLDL